MGRHGDVEIRTPSTVKRTDVVTRQYAYHRKAGVLRLQCLADDMGIQAKGTLPYTVGDHGYWRSIGVVIRRDNRSSQQHPCAVTFKKVARYQLSIGE